MTSSTTSAFRELEHRVNDGIDVRLLWCGPENRLIVAVSDSKSAEAFTIEIAEPECALDVFHHPFAYAAVPEFADRARRSPTRVPVS